MNVNVRSWNSPHDTTRGIHPTRGIHYRTDLQLLMLSKVSTVDRQRAAHCNRSPSHRDRIGPMDPSSDGDVAKFATRGGSSLRAIPVSATIKLSADIDGDLHPAPFIPAPIIDFRWQHLLHADRFHAISHRSVLPAWG